MRPKWLVFCTYRDVMYLFCDMGIETVVKRCMPGSLQPERSNIMFPHAPRNTASEISGHSSLWYSSALFLPRCLRPQPCLPSAPQRALRAVPSEIEAGTGQGGRRPRPVLVKVAATFPSDGTRIGRR